MEKNYLITIYNNKYINSDINATDVSFLKRELENLFFLKFNADIFNKDTLLTTWLQNNIIKNASFNQNDLIDLFNIKNFQGDIKKRIKLLNILINTTIFSAEGKDKIINLFLVSVKYKIQEIKEKIGSFNTEQQIEYIMDLYKIFIDLKNSNNILNGYSKPAESLLIELTEFFVVGTKLENDTKFKQIIQNSLKNGENPQNIIQGYIHSSINNIQAIDATIKAPNKNHHKNEIIINQVLNLTLKTKYSDEIEELSSELKEDIDSFLEKLIHSLKLNKNLDTSKILEIKSWFIAYFNSGDLQEDIKSGKFEIENNEIKTINLFNIINERSLYGEVFKNLQENEGKLKTNFEIADGGKMDVLYCSPYQDNPKRLTNGIVTNDDNWKIEDKSVFIKHHLKMIYITKLLKKEYPENDYSIEELKYLFNKDKPSENEDLKTKLQETIGQTNYSTLIQEIINLRTTELEILTKQLEVLETQKTEAYKKLFFVNPPPFDTKILDKINEISNKKNILEQDHKNDLLNFALKDIVNRIGKISELDSKISEVINKEIQNGFNEYHTIFLGPEIETRNISYEESLFNKILLIKSVEENNKIIDTSTGLEITNTTLSSMHKNTQYLFNNEYYSGNIHTNIEIDNLKTFDLIFDTILQNNESNKEIIIDKLNNIFTNHNSYLEEQNTRRGTKLEEMKTLEKKSSFEDIIKSLEQLTISSRDSFNKLFIQYLDRKISNFISDDSKEITNYMKIIKGLDLNKAFFTHSTYATNSLFKNKLNNSNNESLSALFK